VYQQPTYPQSPYQQPTYPQSAHPQSTFPQSTYPQSTFPQSTFPQSTRQSPTSQAYAPPTAAQQPVSSAPAAYPPSAGYPVPYAGPGAAGPGPGAGEPGGPIRPPRGRLAWPGILALVLVFALVGFAVFQARQIDRLDTELDRANTRLDQEQAADDARLDGLDDRATALEKAAGQVFNPEAIASAVLPSVFRVEAGQFTGTAFAVGGPASGGGTNLFTNFHVVESVWRGGGRDVQIERRGESYDARIVRVDEENDVAQLTTRQKFDGLVTASAAVKSGQQIVVVGAPLGLEDTVTTGVVSAFRKQEDGSGSVIQFSAPINPGNSGGPVINGAKQVVGIATAKAADAEGIGLAVPIKTACDEFKIC
jgi:hypothetical protein